MITYHESEYRLQEGYHMENRGLGVNLGAFGMRSETLEFWASLS